MASVRIIIVNFRTADLTIRCLRSLTGERCGRDGIHAVIADNGSCDGSVDQIASSVQAEGWNAWVEILPLTQNRGFAGGTNAALRAMLMSVPGLDYVLLLNPDTIVRQGAIRELVDFLESRPDVGIAGSRLEDPDGKPQRSAFRFPTVCSEFESGVRLGIISRLLKRWVVAPAVRDTPHAAGWMAGASLMIRRAVFETIGLLDEGFFLYFEETEFCLRAHRAGWSAWYVPASRVVHLVGQSSGVTDPKRVPTRMPRYWFESRRRYFKKAYGPLYALAADGAWAAGFSLWRLRRRLQGKPDQDPPGLLWDFLRFTIFGKQALRGRPA